MDYYEIRTIDGKRIEWGIFASDADAVRWYMRGIWEGWLYKKCGSWFNRVHTEATPKTEATRLAEFKDLEYWPAGVGLTDWVESVCAEMLRLDAALADELNNRDVLDKMLTQCITERDQLRAQVERLQGGEPVAWRVRRHDAPKYWIVFLHKPVDALQDPDREVQPLYTPAAPSQEPSFCDYCGGNDEDPQDHCMDCERPSQTVTLTEEVFGPIVKAAFDAGWAACRASELVGDNAKEFAWDMSGDEITERLIAALRENEALR